MLGPVQSDLYVDLNGDGNINQDDRRPFKNPAPDWILGASSQFSFRNFDASFTARAYLGNSVYNNVASNYGHYSNTRALTYINALRQRAYGSAGGNVTDAQMTLDFIRDERARELFWEGHRRTDLIRFDRFTTNGVWAWKDNVAAGRTTEVFRNLFPLPATELSANPKLKQNTGY